MISNVKIRSRTSGHQNNRNSLLLIQVTCLKSKWCNRFLFAGYDSLHQLIPDHKVRRTGVFIDQKTFCTWLYRFYHICSLRSRTTGILCGKIYCIFLIRQIIDKRWNIDMGYTSSVLGPDLHRSIRSNHVFSSISGDVIVNSLFKCLQKCWFPMISSTHDQSNSFRDSHSFYFTPVWKFHLYFHTFRCFKSNCTFHRLLWYTAFSWQYRTICHKCNKSPLCQFSSYIMLIFRKFYTLFHFLLIQVLII